MKIEERFLDDIDVENRRSFNCGENDISTMSSFLYEEAQVYQNSGTAFTKVFIDSDDNNSIIGYYSLKSSCFQYTDTDKYTGSEIIQVVPAVEIARFAIALKYQGKIIPKLKQKFSSFLMFTALQDIMSLRDYILGVQAAILFSLDYPKQLRFYEREGFSYFCEEDVFQSTENEGCVPMYKILPNITPS